MDNHSFLDGRGDTDPDLAPKDICDALQAGLDGFTFQWLCACAIYPALRFALTIHLGRRLAAARGHAPPDEDAHLALCRLAWFRRGWMPEDVRLAMIHRLDDDLRPVARQALEDLLFNLLNAVSVDARAAGALDYAPAPPSWRAPLRAWFAAAPKGAPQRDAIFVHFMLNHVPTAADLALDRRLHRLFGVRLGGWIDRTVVASALAAMVLGAVIWLAHERLLGAFHEIEVVTKTVPAPQMVALPAGTFVMGSPPDEDGRYDDEGPQRTVTIGAPFAIGKYEVTFDEWDACVEDGGCNEYRPDDRGWGRGRRPVIDVSWEDARTYVTWLREKTGMSYRLPSEAEWEYAARAGTTTAWYWGASANDVCRYANAADLTAKERNPGWTVVECRDGYVEAAPVGQFSANAFGLHDMLGNVFEWVQDCWHDSYTDAPTDGSVWTTESCKARVLRGGSWLNYPWFVRSAYRDGYTAGYRDSDSGFRLARTLPPES